MNNLILFFNAFLSYIVLFLVIIVVAAVAMFIGIKRRKAQDAKALLEQTAAETEMQSKE